MDIKKIIKSVLFEDIASSATIKGSDADTALTRGEYLRDKAMQNLSDLNVYNAKGHMAELGIFDDDYLSKSGPFKLFFTTKGGSSSSGMAKYDKSLSKKENTIVLSFKSDKPICFNQNECYQFFKIKFSPESTHRAYVQKFKVKFGVGPLKYGREESKGLRGLQEGYIFDVTIIPYGKSQNVSGGIQKQRYSRSFKKGLAGQQTKMNFPQPGKQLSMFDHYFNSNAILTEAEGDIIKTQIKINKIGVKKPKGEYDNDSGELTKEDFTKVKGAINLPKEAKSLFDVTTLAKITNYLQKGVFYAKISQKTKNAIILSDSPDYNNRSQYVLLQSKKDIDVTNPQSWSNQKVKVGRNAMGNDEFPSDIEGTIGQLKIVE